MLYMGMIDAIRRLAACRQLNHLPEPPALGLVTAYQQGTHRGPYSQHAGIVGRESQFAPAVDVGVKFLV